jgi:hypothetical protein
MKRFLLVGLICLAVAINAIAQDPLSAARDLYAAAAYEDALVMLTTLRDASSAPGVTERADQYRAFCLFALGRTADAQSVAESLIRNNPILRLETADASPRITAMFAEVRKRLLPGLVRDRYRAARAMLDAQDLSRAEPRFAEVRTLLDEAEEIDVMDETLADLRVLVDGFLDLARSSQAERAADAIPSPASSETASNQLPAAPAIPMIFDQNASGIIAPVAVLQNVPPVPTSLLTSFRPGPTRGTLDVVIDEQGHVERATIGTSIHRLYDAVLLGAAERWIYKPARNGADPVKYRKTIAIVVQK